MSFISSYSIDIPECTSHCFWFFVIVIFIVFLFVLFFLMKKIIGKPIGVNEKKNHH